MKQLLIKFIAIIYLFVVSIPITTIVYLLTFFISIFSLLKKTKKMENQQTTNELK